MPLKAYVEAVDESEEDYMHSATTTDSSPTLSSRTSVSELKPNDDDDVEEIVRAGMLTIHCLAGISLH